MHASPQTGTANELVCGGEAVDSANSCVIHQIQHIIYTTNSVEAYHRQLRKVSKNRGAFPSAEAARKLLYLAHRDIEVKWSKSIFNWTAILNELAIHFEERLPL